MKLTAKQKVFCEEYVKSGNAQQSAIKAGYSAKTASVIANENLNKPYLKSYIKSLQDEIRNDRILDARQMQEYLSDIIRQESEEEVIVVEGCGDGVSEAVTKKKKPSQQDRIKAIQLLARMQGALDNTATVNVVLPVFNGEDDLEE